MKVCSCCGEEKRIDCFQIRKASRDGRTASCKACLSERDKRRESPERKAHRAEYQKGIGRTKSNSAKVRYIERNRKKRAVHIMTGNAIRDGLLKKQSCEVCGTNEHIHAHHDDYNRPLNVRWLCSIHHSEHHRIYGEGKNSR